VHRHTAGAAPPHVHRHIPTGLGAIYPHINFGTVEIRWAGAEAAEERGTMSVRIHDERGAVQLQHTLSLGQTADAEGARWRTALQGEVPTIFDAAARLRLPITGAALLLGVGVMGFVQRSRQRAALERRRALKKAA
jgi:hypothetical protein